MEANASWASDKDDTTEAGETRIPREGSREVYSHGWGWGLSDRPLASTVLTPSNPVTHTRPPQTTPLSASAFAALSP